MNSHDKILIIRLSAIGDVVFASPLIKALRFTYPKAHISWLVESGAASLLMNNAHLDKVIVLPRAQWKKLWHQRRFLQLYREIKYFTTMLRNQGFDIALDLQGLLKSGIWAFLSGAKIRIGLGSKEGSKYLMTRLVGNQLLQSEWWKQNVQKLKKTRKDIKSIAKIMES